MIDNKYTRTLSSISAPPKSIEKAIRTVYEINSHNTKKGKVTIMKKRTWTAAAAGLAAVFAAVGIFGQSFYKQDAKNSFIITANAQELKPDTEIVFGLINSGSGYGREFDDTDRLSISQFTALPIRCEGENIESVTYTLDSEYGYNTDQFLELAEKYKDIVQHYEPDDRIGYRWLPYSVPARSYTVAYEDQPYFGTNGMALDGKKQSEEEPIPVVLITRFKIEPSLFGFENSDEWAEANNDLDFRYPSEWYDILQQLYEEDNNDSKIIVSVHYKDGTSETKTICLSCRAASKEYPSGTLNYMEICGTLCDTQTNDIPE